MMANFNGGFQIFESVNAVEQILEDKEVHIPLSFWERIFNTDPYANLWTMTRVEIIQVVVHKPAIYRMGDKLIVHPALVPEIRKAMMQKTKDIFKW